MPAHLLIDGYNLMGCSRKAYGLGNDTLEEAREKFIDRLARYRGLKGIRVTVVFDGGKAGYPTRRTERRRGLEIIYSRLGEEADYVIKELVRESGKTYAVVTSDREIINAVERCGMAVFRSGEFDKKMEVAEMMSDKGIPEEEEEDSRITTKKKGNPRRLSKKERKRKAVWKKI